MRHEHLLVHFLELAGESRIIQWRCSLHREKIKKLQDAYRGTHPDPTDAPEFERDMKKVEKHEKAISLMQSHRQYVVRDHARSAHIAYNFLRGKKYSEVEAKAKTKPNWINIQEFVLKFWDKEKFPGRFQEVQIKFNVWLLEAEAYYRIHRIGYHHSNADDSFRHYFKDLDPKVRELVRTHEEIEVFRNVLAERKVTVDATSV